jgi:outer membrane immunogenic protein
MRVASLVCLAILASSGVSRADSGAYVEAHGGYDNLQNDDYFNLPTIGFRFRPTNGAVYGVAAGYDAPISGRIFAGVQATLDESSGRTCQVNPLILAPGIFESCLRLDRDIGANVRIGTSVGSKRQLLVYALAGYSNTRLTSSFQINRTNESGFSSRNVSGVRLGVGANYALTHLVFGKLEYRHSNFADGVSRNQALAGFGVRF